jgi:hypothetical protein
MWPVVAGHLTVWVCRVVQVSWFAERRVEGGDFVVV